VKEKIETRVGRCGKNAHRFKRNQSLAGNFRAYIAATPFFVPINAFATFPIPAPAPN
jgi:hypothetical protein